MPTITVNEDGKGSYDQNKVRLVRLDEEWAFNLFRHVKWEPVPAGRWAADVLARSYRPTSVEWKPAPFNCSWFHRCLNANMYLRCDYIKNIDKYYAHGNEPARIQYGHMIDALGNRAPGCVHCYKTMPNKYARLFQLYFLSARLKHPLMFGGTRERNPV